MPTLPASSGTKSRTSRVAGSAAYAVQSSDGDGPLLLFLTSITALAASPDVYRGIAISVDVARDAVLGIVRE